MAHTSSPLPPFARSSACVGRAASASLRKARGIALQDAVHATLTAAREGACAQACMEQQVLPEGGTGPRPLVSESSEASIAPQSGREVVRPPTGLAARPAGRSVHEATPWTRSRV